MKSNFEEFSDQMFDIIFQHLCDYMSDILGTDGWGEEYHELHGDIMFRVVEKIYKDMTPKK